VPVRDRDRDGAALRSVICLRCGLVWTDPRPSAADVRAFYLRDYRLQYKRTRQPKPKHTLRAGAAALERLERLRPFLRDGIRLFDLGAGGGEVVYVARALGCCASGLEPNQGYAEYAAEVLGVPVAHGLYQDAVISPGSQDVVTMFHTAEHLEDPFDAMRVSRDWLTSHGVLAVEVPNVEAVCQQPHQQFHRGHLYHFNLATLEQMGRCAGYDVHSSGTSADGGNIWAIFHKADGARRLSGELPGNYERVRAVLDGHTALRHALTRYPYLRPMRKLAARLSEWWLGRASATAADLLDGMVGRARAAAPHGRQGN
jgi:hypothetical protein